MEQEREGRRYWSKSLKAIPKCVSPCPLKAFKTVYLDIFAAIPSFSLWNLLFFPGSLPPTSLSVPHVATGFNSMVEYMRGYLL